MKRALCPSALLLAAVALVAPTTASAYDIWVNLTGPAADLEIDLAGTTLTVTSHTAAVLSHNAGANCAVSGSSLICNFIASYNISGSHSADNFDVTLNGSTAYPISVSGRQGDDTFQLLDGTSGRVDMVGDNGTDTFTVGASGSNLLIDVPTSVRLLPGASGLLGDVFDVYADVHGFLAIVGTPNLDIMTLEGNVERSSSVGGLWDVDAGPGDDLIDVAVGGVKTTYAISAAVERATFLLKARDGFDTVQMIGDVTLTGGIYEIHGEGHDDTLDMGGPTCALLAQDYASTWTSQALLDGGIGADIFSSPCTITTTGGSTFTNVW